MEESQNKIVSVITVFNIKDYIEYCLNSIIEQTYPELEIIAIDNSLDNNFSQEIIKRYPGIKLFPQSRNISYCEALNLGIGKSKGDFILCLNDDTILDKDFIRESIRGFYADSKIGMVSGKILRSDGKTIDSAGLFLSIWRTAKERGYGCKDKGQHEKEEYVFGVNGAVAFYRRQMLEGIKIDSDYFDNDYRFFYEDLDAAWRGRNLGWKAYYIPKAIAYHIRGGTARASCGINKPYARRYLSAYLQTDLIKNRYLTIIKNESVAGFLLHLPFILSYDILVWIYVLFFRPGLVKKIILNLKYLRPALNKRALIKKAGL